MLKYLHHSQNINLLVNIYIKKNIIGQKVKTNTISKLKMYVILNDLPNPNLHK